MKATVASTLLFATALSGPSTHVNLMELTNYSQKLKVWAWSGLMHIEPTLIKHNGTFKEIGNGNPDVEQYLVIADIGEEVALTSIDDLFDSDKFGWFDRLTFVYHTELNIWSVLD